MLIGLCLIFTLVFFYFFFTRVEGLRGKNTMSQSINKQQQEKQASNNQEKQQSLNKKKQASNKQKKPPRKKQKQPLKPPSIQPYFGIKHMGQSSNLNLNSI